MPKSVRRPSPALIVAVVALVAALAGSAIALPGKNSVKKNDIAKNAVTSKAIKNNKVTGADVKESSLGEVPSAATAANLNGFQRKGQTRVVATTGANFDAAFAAAPEVTLFSAGPLTVYGKCLTDEAGPNTYAYAFMKTSQNGVIFDSDNSTLRGDPDFLDTDTDPFDAEIAGVSSGADSASIYLDYPQFGAMAPDGTAVHGFTELAVKQGTLAGGNGVYGDGNVCIFAGEMTQYTG